MRIISLFLQVTGPVPDGPANLSMTHSALALDIVNIIFSIRDELASVGVFKLVGCRPSCYFCMPQAFNKRFG
jgi:hypothetical protein